MVSNKLFFGQIVIGPPGSGKTTYCTAMRSFMEAAGRKVAFVNLDPANENLPENCEVNIQELITLSDAMEKLNLGPNGGMIYCLEYLEKNLKWLRTKLNALPDKTYLLFDCPGQVELFSNHQSMKNIVRQFQNWDYRITAVNLVDSHYCADPSKFISVLLLSLSTMLHLELPHLNILSKVDLLEKHSNLPFNLEFYTDVMDLSYLIQDLEKDEFGQKFAALNSAICELIEDFSLVTFMTLSVRNRSNLLRIMKAADKSNGYIFGDAKAEAILGATFAAEDFRFFRAQDAQEEYMETGDDLLEKTSPDLFLDS
uniref:GPN-loop GTPase 2 n=2 Tax=Hirondellea gigas TaxID=1518452 RepID=A0A6A7G934_9CRUS